MALNRSRCVHIEREWYDVILCPTREPWFDTATPVETVKRGQHIVAVMVAVMVMVMVM